MAVPTKDSLLVPYSGNWEIRITESPETFGLTAAQATQLTALRTPYVAAYETMMEALSNGTRSKNLTNIKDSTKAALVPYLRVLYAQVAANIAVTDADKILLGITIRKAPSPIPPPTVAPGMDLIHVAGRTVRVNIHDSASSAKRGKPAGVAGACVYSFVGETYPSDPGEWTYEGQTTKGSIAVTFPESVAPGSQVWIMSAWYNAKAETGPLATPITAYVQRGLSQAA